MPIHSQPGGSNDNGAWMPRPDDSVDFPPGLEYLTLVDYIFVKQSHESWEVSLGVETRNKYVLKNATGQQVYYAYEESDACARFCEGKDRGFILHVIDNSGREVMRIIREYNECAGCCGGSCAGSGSSFSHQVTVEAPPDNIIGTVCQCASSTMYSYEISDQDGKPVLFVDSPGFFNMAFGEAHSFSIKTNSGSDIGEIRKEWSGFLQELFTDADNFGVKFPLDLSVFVKATLIGATFLIDFVHFEDSE